MIFLDAGGVTAAIAVFVGNAVLISFKIETRTLVTRIISISVEGQIRDIISQLWS